MTDDRSLAKPDTGPGGTEVRLGDDTLVIARRTYRSGDFVHYVLCFFVLLIALVLLWIGISHGTLFKGWTLPALELGVFAWAWFCLTKMRNRRTVAVDGETLVRSDGPVPSLARRVEVPRDKLGQIRITERRTWTMPPTSMVTTYNVVADTGGGDLTLFPRLLFKKEAEFIATRLEAFLGGTT